MKILSRNRIFQALGSNALSEYDYENLILDRSHQIYPGWKLIPFKVSVQSPHGLRKPDLALVALDYSEWWVVEVELEHHSFPDHVLPQVETFHDGHYGENHARALMRHLPLQDEGQITEMVRSVHPRVHVIVNQEVPSWVAHLSQIDATIGIVEVYQSEEGEMILRTSGTIPQLPASRRSRCVRDRAIPSAFRVVNSGLAALLADHFRILVDGRITYWQRPSPYAHLILPTGGDPFSDRHSFLVFRDESGELHATTQQPDI